MSYKLGIVKFYSYLCITTCFLKTEILGHHHKGTTNNSDHQIKMVKVFNK